MPTASRSEFGDINQQRRLPLWVHVLDSSHLREELFRMNRRSVTGVRTTQKNIVIALSLLLHMQHSHCIVIVCELSLLT